MAKTAPFDNYLAEYEQWFDDHYFVFLSELEAIRSVLPTKGKGVEIGVGSGLFASALGISEGCDPSENMRAKAIERGINVVNGIAEDLPYGNASIDYALMVTTICFVDDPQQSIREIHRILKPHGKLIIGFVDKDSPVGKEYLKNKDKSLFYKDACFFSTEDIYKLLRNAGFTIKQTCQTIFSALNEVNEIQRPEKGFSKGSFVVIKARKENIISMAINSNFLKVKNSDFFLGENKIVLKGVGIGNWLNLEHFMMGIPGTEKEIRETLLLKFGAKNATLFWDAYFRNFFNEQDIVFIKNNGFNSIRIAINHHHFNSPGSFEQSLAVKEINRIIPYSRENNILIILDMHTSPGGQNPDWHSDNNTGKDNFWQDPSAQSEIVSLWGKIADYYKNEPVIAAYDLLNEPCYFNPENNEIMIKFYEHCTREIRRYDTRHILIYEGNEYARDFSMFTENLDDNSAYSFHYYPFLQLPAEKSNGNLKDILDKKFREDISLEHLKSFNKPIWCGETGHLANHPVPQQALIDFLQLLDSYNISWALWPYKDIGDMGLVGLTGNNNWLKNTRTLTGNWNFWKIFTQDSLVSAQKNKDKYAYYQQLARETTMAHKIFALNVNASFSQLFIDATEEFSFDKVSLTEQYKNILPEIIKK